MLAAQGVELPHPSYSGRALLLSSSQPPAELLEPVDDHHDLGFGIARLDHDKALPVGRYVVILVEGVRIVVPLKKHASRGDRESRRR